MRRRFIQCDVFSDRPALGNGLAVVLDAEGLSEEAMRTFARWTNLAETTFLLPPREESADYRVRIFTPSRELPFAGHPTLGSCMSWLHAGGRPAKPGIVRQECAIGIVEIDVSGERPAFAAPPTRIAPLAAEAFESILRALRLDPACVLSTVRLENGPVWQVLELADAQAVLSVDSSLVRWPAFNSIGLIGAHPADAECDFEVRHLSPSSGMSEDPITGSLNAALAVWLQTNGRLTRPLTVAQGTAAGRAGRVFIQPPEGNDGRILVGGAVSILIEGTLTL